MQAFDGGHSPRAQDEAVSHRLHGQHDHPAEHYLRHYVPGKRAEVRIHYVDWHLRRVEVKVILLRYLQHPQMNVRIFVAGEADVADLAGLLRLQRGVNRTLLCKDAVRIVETYDLVKLHQVDEIRA